MKCDQRLAYLVIDDPPFGFRPKGGIIYCKASTPVSIRLAIYFAEHIQPSLLLFFRRTIRFGRLWMRRGNWNGV